MHDAADAGWAQVRLDRCDRSGSGSANSYRIDTEKREGMVIFEEGDWP